MAGCAHTHREKEGGIGTRCNNVIHIYRVTRYNSAQSRSQTADRDSVHKPQTQKKKPRVTTEQGETNNMF